MGQFIDSFTQKLKDHKIADADNPLIPCSDSEIAELEQLAGGRLPCMFRSYLRTMGRASGAFLRGGKHTYSELLQMRDDADATFEKSQVLYRLSPTEVVFWMSSDNQFLFFDASQSNDPEVYYYRENAPAPEKKFDHFSEALRAMLLDELAARGPNLQKNRTTYTRLPGLS